MPEFHPRSLSKICTVYFYVLVYKETDSTGTVAPVAVVYAWTSLQKA